MAEEKNGWITVAVAVIAAVATVTAAYLASRPHESTDLAKPPIVESHEQPNTPPRAAEPAVVASPSPATSIANIQEPKQTAQTEAVKQAAPESAGVKKPDPQPSVPAIEATVVAAPQFDPRWFQIDWVVHGKINGWKTTWFIGTKGAWSPTRLHVEVNHEEVSPHNETVECVVYYSGIFTPTADPLVVNLEFFGKRAGEVSDNCQQDPDPESGTATLTTVDFTDVRAAGNQFLTVAGMFTASKK